MVLAHHFDKYQVYLNSSVNRRPISGLCHDSVFWPIDMHASVCVCVCVCARARVCVCARATHAWRKAGKFTADAKII